VRDGAPDHARPIVVWSITGGKSYVGEKAKSMKRGGYTQLRRVSARLGWPTIRTSLRQARKLTLKSSSTQHLNSGDLEYMRRRLFSFLILAIAMTLSAGAQQRRAASESELTDEVKKQLVSAVEDEIYDYNLEGKFRSVGKALGNEGFQIPLFVTNDSKGSSYYVIYRLMPYGEMYRLITVGDDGLARLFRNPRSGFPPDAPASQTLYYDDEEICHAKHDAMKLSFVVNINPSSERLKEAIDRQKKRYGFSNLEEHRAKRKAR
jgi:hypothetical protein